jgi:hypothetical protein
MSIVDVRETFAGREGGVNEKGERTYTRVFRVQTDSAYDGPLFVRLASGVPRIGDVYATSTELDTGATVRTVDPQQDDDNPRLWIITVAYDSAVDQEQRDENPLARPAEIAWDFQQYTRAVWKDADGKAILNSAGDYFDPPIEVDDSRPVLTITRNEAAFNPALAIDYQDAVNTDPFFGFAARQVKVAKISSQRAFENNVSYWRTSYEFHMRRDGWKVAVLDQGRRQKGQGGDAQGQTDPNKVYQILDGSGQPISDPVPLDGAGRRLASPGPTTAKFREFEIYKERPFAAFNLP